MVKLPLLHLLLIFFQSTKLISFFQTLLSKSVDVRLLKLCCQSRKNAENKKFSQKGLSDGAVFFTSKNSYEEDSAVFKINPHCFLVTYI